MSPDPIGMKLGSRSRLMIIGNSGSGKTTLARAIGRRFALPIHHLDSIRWEALGAKREDEVARSMVRSIAEGDVWVV